MIRIRSMRRSALQVIFKAFQMTSRCYAAEDGVGGGETTAPPTEHVDAKTGADAGGDPAPKADPTPKDDAKSADSELEGYIGSKEVNPRQLPLKKFDRRGKSKEEIDKLIEVSDGELFLSEEELAKIEKQGKEKGDKGRDEKGKFTPKEKKEDGDKPKADAEPDPAKFYESVGITEEQFKALPEKTQEVLAGNYLGNAEKPIDEKAKQVEEQYNALKTDLQHLTNDPVIAARVEELQSGKAFVAKELPGVTDQEMGAIDQALAANDPATAKKLINEAISKRAADAISRERSIVDTRAARKQAEKDAFGVFMDIAKLDKRLASDFTYEQFSTIKDVNDPAYKKSGGLAEIVDFCTKNKINLVQVKEWGPQKLYKLIAADKGWDKERDQNIAKTSVTDFLKKIKSSQPKAKEMDHGRRSPAPESESTPTGVNRAALIDEIASGNTSNYQRLLEANDGNPQMIALLGEIQQAGMKLGRDRRRESLQQST